jgi:hypothetical protein
MQLPSKEQNDEECDARDDDSSNVAWLIKKSTNKKPGYKKQPGKYFEKYVCLLPPLFGYTSFDSSQRFFAIQ